MEIKALSAINCFPKILLLAALFFQGCRETAVESTDPLFSMQEGKLFYNGKEFTGRTRTVNPVLEEEYITSYKNGAEDGEYTAKAKNGQILEQRYFVQGLKQGIHISWFPNGQPRLYSEFDKGNYINDRWAWYDNGQPYTYEKYDKNGKILASKVWSRTGQIYMNLAFSKNGSSTGMPGGKLCEPIKNPDQKKLDTPGIK